MGRQPPKAVTALGLIVVASMVWPAAATTAPRRATDTGLLVVDCPSVRGCAALGYHNSGNFGKQSVGVFAGAGRWSRRGPLGLPADVWRFGADFFGNRQPEPRWVNRRFNAMSCPSARNCTVVGAYQNKKNFVDGVLLTETDGRWARGISVRLPADALRLRPRFPQPDNSPTSVSCASAGNCTAVGFYTAFDHTVQRQGLLLSLVNGSWQRGVRAPLPPDGVDNVELNAVSCAAPGSCTAVGNYDNEATNHPGVLLTQTNGAWEPAVRALLPASVWRRHTTLYQYMDLQAVSCSSPGNCTAVGMYSAVRHRSGGVLLTQTDGKWATGVPAPLPANHAPRQITSATHVYLNSVSCASPGNCTAVGDYVARGGHQHGLLLTQTDGRWTAAEARLPGRAWHASLGPGVTLKSVSCASAGNCTAVGSYYGPGGRDSVPLILTQTNGRWAKGVARPPAGAAHLSAFEGSGPDYFQTGLSSVSCASAGNCTAVGQLPHNRSGDYWGLRVTKSNGHWGRAVWVKW
jgi:hypothetical protein